MDELATLIRLAKLALDEKRKALAALEARVAAVEAEKAALLAQLEAERQHPPEALEGGLTQGAFIRATYRKRDQLDAQLAALAQQIALAQDAIRTAFEELKRYDIAADQRARAHRRDANRRETKALDEAGSDVTRRRKEDV